MIACCLLDAEWILIVVGMVGFIVGLFTGAMK